MVTILGDVTYGGCCIDDVTAKFIEADFLVHYGHSCLVPVDHVSVRCMYVFVDVLFDVYHFVESVKLNVPLRALPNIVESEEPQQPPAKRIALLGTIQYSRALHEACELLSEHFGSSNVIIPRESPLTSGEVLGCTSPTLITGDERDCEICIFVSDGRFHLESAMIQNPSVFFYRYDPFSKKLFHETYGHEEMHNNRRTAISRARNAQSVGIILSTLGRQGSIGILENLERLLAEKNILYFVILMGEILPHKLKAFKGVDAFIQVGCPRLSIDWGHHYDVPLLTPYECYVAFSSSVTYKEVYPMDFYSKQGGVWSNYGTGGHRNGSLAPAVSSAKEGIRERLAARLAARQCCSGTKICHSNHVEVAYERT